MEYLKEYLEVSSLIKDEPKVELDLKKVLERSTFMKILSESVTRDLKTEVKNEN